jgi:hypothetical protein
VLLDALLTAAFAYGFALLWTDELVDGSPYAIADPVGTGVQGVAAGLWPTVVGLGLCAVLVVGTGVAWWWPALLVAAAGASGAVLGAAARFPEGMPHAPAAVLGVLALVGAVGLVSDAGSSRRRRRHEHYG